MGLFISNCPSCHSEIEWFLHPPKNYICKKCERYISEAEIELSWRKREGERLREALHEAQNLMCDVAQETRDLGLLEGETNAKVQEYAKKIKESKSY